MWMNESLLCLKNCMYVLQDVTGTHASLKNWIHVEFKLSMTVPAIMRTMSQLKRRSLPVPSLVLLCSNSLKVCVQPSKYSVHTGLFFIPFRVRKANVTNGLLTMNGIVAPFLPAYASKCLSPKECLKTNRVAFGFGVLCSKSRRRDWERK